MNQIFTWMKDHRKFLLILIYAIIIPASLLSYYIAKGSIPWQYTANLNKVDLPEGNSVNMVQDGDTLYVLEDYYGLRIYNIENPENPELTGSWINRSVRYSDLAYENNTVYIAAYSFTVLDNFGYLFVLNVQNESDITQIGQYNQFELFKSLKVRNDIVYLTSSLHLLILNATEPDNLQILTTYRIHYGNEHEVEIKGDFLFLGDYRAGVKIFNIKNVSSIELISTLDGYGTGMYATLNEVSNIIVNDSYFIIMDNYHGIILYNIENINSPEYLLSYSIGGIINDIVCINNTLYCSDYINGVDFIDISNPMEPLSLGTDRTLYHAVAIEKKGDILYVLDNSGLNVLMIHNGYFPNPIESKFSIKVIEGVSGAIILLTAFIYLVYKLNNSKILQ